MKKVTALLLILCLISSVLISCVPEDLGISFQKKYTVTFNSDGGTEVQKQEVTSGSKVSAPEDPTKEGYTFEGWYYGNELWSFVGYVVTEDMTLTAKWKEIEKAPSDDNTDNTTDNGDDDDQNTPDNDDNNVQNTPDNDDNNVQNTPDNDDNNAQNTPDNDDNNVQNTPDNDDNVSTAIPEYNGGEITITFYHTMGAALRVILDDAIAEFNALYPNITVEHMNTGSYDDVRDQIRTEITVGNQPNLAYCYPDHVALYNVANAVVTLDELINDPTVGFTDEQLADFIEGFYNEGCSFGDGKMYSLPLSKSTEVLYYNKTFFEANGLTVPTTWEEMEAVCRAIKEIDPYSTPLAYDSESNWFITMCEQYGSPYTSAEGDHFLFDNEINRSFVKTFRQWYQDGLVTTQELMQSYSSNAFTNTSGYGTHCYMSIGSSAGAGYYKTSSFEIGITSIPQIDPANPKVISQGPSICIFKQSDPQEVAATWLFAKFLTTNVEFQASMSMQSGYMPVIKSVQEHPIYAAFLDSYATNIRAYSTKIAIEQQDAYFASPAFNGSSVARDQVGLLLQKCFITTTDDIDAMIKKAFEEAVAESRYQSGI